MGILTRGPSSLRHRAAIGLVILFAVTGALWFGLLQSHIRNEIVGLEQDKVRIYATAMAAQIDSDFRQAMTELETIAALPDIRAMRPALLPSTLTILETSSSHFRAFTVLDSTGRVIARPSKPERVGEDRSKRPYFVVPMREGRTHVGELGISTAGNLSLTVGTPIHDARGTIAGVLHGSLGLMDRNPKMYRAILRPAVPREWDVFLTTRDGRLIARAERVGEDRAPRVGDRIAHPILEGAAAGRPGVQVIDFENARWHAIGAQVPNSGWTVVVQVPESILRANVASIVHPVAGFMAAALAMLGVAGLVLLVRMIAPLERLTTALRLFGRGGFPGRIPGAGRGEIAEAIQAFNDMADGRVRMEQALRAGEERHRRFFNEDLSAHLIADADGRILDCNPAFARMFGYPTIGAALAAGLDPLFPEAVAKSALFDRLRTATKVEMHEVELRRRDGQPLHALVNAVASFGPDGGLAEIQGFLVDVTERKRLEQMLSQAQKMEAVGRLAGGIAHDFNNLLTAVLGYANLLLGRPDLTDTVRTGLEEIRGAAERAGALTQQLLAFSRKQVLQPRLLHLGRVVSGLEMMLRRVIGEDIVLEIRAASDLGSVRADQGQIEQVIVNLAVNARDAMPAGGRLMIESSNVDLDHRFIARHAGARPGPHVLLSVRDTGCGMDAAVRARLFEPFYTTKGLGRGTGLGLSTVYGIVKQSGGCIFVDSEPGQGTTFRIYLPLVPAPALPREDPRPPAMECAPGSETVLVVEDEDAVRRLVCVTLRERGYTVLDARNAEDALAIAAASPPFDLLLTDVVMPGLNGRELWDRLQRLRPGARVLFMSGYTEDEVLRRGLQGSGSAYLQKPFTPADLARAVRAAFDRPLRAAV
jgi:PAS domain S-box-containing protein